MSATGVVAVLAMACTAACGSDDSTATKPSDGGAPDGTTTVAEASTPADSGTTGGGVASCLVGSGTTSTLSAGCSALQQCVETNCNADFTAAFGPGWLNGTVAGDCQGFYACSAAAGCTQSAITGCEPSIGATCGVDLYSVSTCLQNSCAAQGAACNTSLGSPLDAGSVDAASADAGIDAD